MGLQRKTGAGIQNPGKAAIPRRGPRSSGGEEREDHVVLKEKGEDHVILEEKGEDHAALVE